MCQSSQPACKKGVLEFVVQVVGHWPITRESRVQFQASHAGLVVDRVHWDRFFFPNSSGVSVSIVPPMPHTRVNSSTTDAV